MRLNRALHITSAHIARPLSPSTGSVDVSTDKALTFSGVPTSHTRRRRVYLRSGRLPGRRGLQSGDFALYRDAAGATDQPSRFPPDIVPGSREPGFRRRFAQREAVDHWYQISGVDVAASPQAASVVVMGDSITDGRGSTTNGNDRWPTTSRGGSRLRRRRGRSASSTSAPEETDSCRTVSDQAPWRGSTATCWLGPACAA